VIDAMTAITTTGTAVAACALLLAAQTGRAQEPPPEKWALGEFAKVRRQAYNREYDRVAYLGPYAKWMMEEVGSIIAPDEQVTFEALGSDAARDQFIEKFWARRGGEAKERYYQKLKIVVARFVAPGTRGFLDDRGFFYMIYGPPDEIEASATDKPQTWTYRSYRHPDGSTSSFQFKFDGKGDITPDTNPFFKRRKN
jgi:GWxTD domain-containing protein